MTRQCREIPNQRPMKRGDMKGYIPPPPKTIFDGILNLFSVGLQLTIILIID
jgi:hypothetical protein